MKTDQLATLLATGVTPVRRHAAARQVRTAVIGGGAVSALLMVTLYGPRHDLAQAMHWPMFWFKQLFPLVFAVGGVLAVQRLGRPGVPLGRAAWLLALPVAVVWVVALWAWFAAPEGARAPLLLGQTWRSCALSILFLSAPVLVGGLFALRNLAPTRPALAGAAAGALASGVGATVYALHCPELTAPFLAVWYVLGMALPIAIGALAGPRLLRW